MVIHCPLQCRQNHRSLTRFRMRHQKTCGLDCNNILGNTYKALSCANRLMVIRTSRIVTSTLRPTQRIAMEIIWPFPEVLSFKLIIVSIDTFTRYVQLFPISSVSATVAANRLWCHCCRFCATDMDWSGYTVHESNPATLSYNLWHKPEIGSHTQRKRMGL